MKKIIITGASGFIGRALIDYLKDKNCKVIPYSSKNGDVNSQKTWDKMQKANVVIHLAAMTYVPDSWEHSKKFLSVNSLSLLNAINYCKKNKCRLIFLSSFIYDNVNENPIKENALKSPQNPYALSKKIAEEICEFYKKVDNLDVIILRPFNVFGFGQKKTFLIPTIINQILDGEIISIMDIKPRRDYIFINDLINAIEKSILYKGNKYIFNIGSGKSYSVLEVINTLQDLFKTNLSVKCSKKTRKMEIDETIADITLANIELNWRPKYTLKSALKEIVDIYQTK